MKYRIQISPVVRNQSAVVKFLHRIFSSGELQKKRAEELVKKGGIVVESIFKAAADSYAEKLRQLGVQVEVLEMAEDDQEEGYQVKLIDAGDRSLEVIKEVRVITGLGLKDSKELVEGLGVVGIYSSGDEADRIKEILTAAGAKVSITKLGDKKPEPDDKDKPPLETEEFFVFGKVFIDNEEPAISYSVRAFDRDLRSEQLLGESETDIEGKYKILYSSDKFRRADKGQADLRLRVFDQNNKEVAIHPLQKESDTIFNADPETYVNLHILAEEALLVSDYEKMVKAITPLLDGVQLTEITWDDAQFLSREVDFSAEQIFWVGEDRRLSQQTGLPASLFFAWALQEIGVDNEADQPNLDLAEVLERDAKALVNEHLQEAIEREHIPDLLAEPKARERLIEQLLSLQEESAEEPRRVKRQRIRTLGSLAGLDENEVQILQDLELDAVLGDADLVDNLVGQGKIAADKKDPLKLTLNLSALTEKRTALVEKLLQEPIYNGQKARSLKDFTNWDKSNWQNFLEKNDIHPEAGSESVEAYAHKLNKRVELLYPTDTWFARNVQKDRSDEWQMLHQVEPLFAQNDTLFRPEGPQEISLEAVEHPDQVRQDLKTLNELTNLYAPLGVQETFNHPELSTGEKINFARQQISLLQTFRNDNPDFDLMATPLSVFSEEVPLNLDNIPEEQRHRVLNTLKREQRLINITGDPSESAILAKNGIHGASDILSMPRQVFLASEMAENLMYPKEIWNRSKIKVSEALRRGLMVRETGSIFNNTLAGNIGEDLEPLRRMPGYEELFGTASYCKCNHCQSIFSPAAYFVDLMRWCEGYVPNWEGRQGSLSLKVRRPDLWNLPLSCENTHTLIPTLTIVNEVLESFVAQEMGDPDGGSQPNLSNRQEVQALVYGKLLNRAVHAHSLPFSLPHYEVQIYLSHLGFTIPQVAALTLSEDTWQNLVLGLTEQAFNFITTPRLSQELLTELYGKGIVGDTVQPHSERPNQEVQEIDVPLLLNALGISRDELSRLMTIPFITKGGLKIKQHRSAGSIQADREVVEKATYQTLSQLHQFVRLWRHLDDWPPEALGLYADLGINMLDMLPDCQYLAAQLGLEQEEVFSLIFYPAERPTHPKRESVLDRLFNPPLFTAEEERLPGTQPFLHPTHPSFSTTPATPKPASLPRFLAALRLSDEDFILLLENLFGSEPANLKFVPDGPKLSLLYRHTVLAERLSLSISELFTAIRLCPSITGNHLKLLVEILDLVDFVRAVRDIGISWDKLAIVLDENSPEEQENQLQMAAKLRDQIVLAMHTEGVLTFSSTVFGSLAGLEEPYSQKLVDQLTTASGGTAVIEKIGSNGSQAYRLTQTFDPLTPLTISLPLAVSNQGLTEPDFRAHLLQFASASLLPIYLANALNLSEKGIRLLLSVLQVNTDDSSYYADIHNSSALQDANAPLSQLIIRLQPWMALIQALALSEDTLQILGNSFADKGTAVLDVFGITDEGSPSWETVRRISLYQVLAAVQPTQRKTLQRLLILPEVGNLSEFVDRDGDQAVEALVQVLSDDPANAKTNQATVRAILAQKWDQRVPELFGLLVGSSSILNDLGQRQRRSAAQVLREISIRHRPFSLTSAPSSYREMSLDMLFQLYQQLTLQRSLRVGVNTLKEITSSQYADATQAARALRASLKTKYDEAKWTEVSEALDEKLAEQQRDALQVYLLKTFPRLFWRESDLFYYFLLDTDFGGCARTSRVKAATLSLQLYVHRISLNLEQIEQDEEMVGVLRKDIDPQGWQEWKWLKNYRVWEANRKVFLHPENYLEPDFRDNRSPQFKALADELLQVELTEESAEQAYKTYLTQFERLAQLRIAGAYFDDGENTLYVFGISSNKECYWRKFVRQVNWTPWEKLDFPVDSLYVSPVKYNGKLYLFWLKARVQEKVTFEDGDSKSKGFIYHRDLHYSHQNSNGKWESINSITLEAEHHTDNVDNQVKKDLEDELISLKVFIETVDENLYVSIGISYSGIWDKFGENDYKLLGKRFNLDLLTKTLVETTISLPSASTTTYCISRIHVVEKHWFPTRLFNEVRFYISHITPRSDKQVLSDSFKKPDYDIGYLANIPIAEYKWNIEHDISTNYNGHNIFHIDGMPYLMMNKRTKIDLLKISRFSTTLVPEFQKIIYNQGLNAFLSLSTQKLQEKAFPLETIYPKLTLPSVESKLDFTGAMGNYFRELFFHIPFKIAHQLNANQRFREAQHWLHFIFNPLPEENSNGEKENFWQYIEFRTHNIKTLREQLEDEAAIEEYKRDPFNPFAIARLRLSAFQKAVFMKYIDNLIDWGDYLFAQDTMETINEANLLYVMASDLLGPKPVSVGECQIALEDEERTYEKIKKTRTSEFLYEMEQYIPIYTWSKNTGRENSRDNNLGASWSKIAGSDKPKYGSFKDSGVAILINLPVFCVPENQQLLSYWDRVEGRLYKLRNCMNIKGIRRQLALFQPPIDPAMLVRARAAGLSIEEIVASVNSPLPLYRFAYLFERAKSYTAQVQSFGSTLLSLLEKQDAAAFTLLINEQQQELQQETRTIKELKLEEINHQLSLLEVDLQKKVIRKIHLTELASENNKGGSGIGGQYGISGEEKNQIKMLETSTTLRIVSSYFNTAASIAFAVPQVGAPTAMTYGGDEVGSVLSAISMYANAGASIADMEGTRSSLVGGYKRRHNEWMHQLNLLAQEENQLVIQGELLSIRTKVAEQDLKVFDRSGEQTRELYDFHKSKFTNKQLYNWMLTEVQKMYRESYRTAQEMAKLAEQAYHFERDEDQTIYIQNGHWDSTHRGLLAGERLSMQLQRMERAYLEKDQRHLEIDQAFSLMQFNPQELLSLRSSGSCEFTIPEFLFDLTYPGHYRRKIKSVRLTIPCITGPYTNIGVTLTLLGSKIRMEANVDIDLVAVPRAKNDAIATSTAQNDGGQFTLDFNGARYLPFEGAGAVESSWKLDLPNRFRSFDYNTIADVLIHVSYTAKDGIDREKVSDNLQTKFQEAAKQGLHRILSLQQEFSAEFQRLLHRPAGEAITLHLQRKYFPFFLQSAKSIKITSARLFLKTSADTEEVKNFALKVNDTRMDDFIKFPSENAKNLFEGNQNFVSDEDLILATDPVSIKLTLEALGNLADDNHEKLKPDSLKDMLLLIDYQASF